MKLKFTVKKTVKVTSEEVINKITWYLKNHDYKIIELADGIIVFNEDFYGSRLSSRSDYYTRVDDGKFELISDKQTALKLIYRVSITFEFVVLTILAAAAIWINYHFAYLYILLVINFICKVYYISNNFLNDVINS